MQHAESPSHSRTPARGAARDAASTGQPHPAVADPGPPARGVRTLWYARCPAPTAASIAIRNGWLEDAFREDGIQVLSLAASSDKAVQLSHYRHTQPNSFRFGGYVPPLVARSRGADVRVVGLAWTDRAAEIVVRADSPIRSARDLQGKRWAVPRRCRDDIDWWQATVVSAYAHAIERLGWRSTDVHLTEVHVERAYLEDATGGAAPGMSLWGARSQFAVQREEAAALVRGEVDALFTDAAMGALLKAAYGFRPVLALPTARDARGPNFGTPSVLTVSGALLDERPDLVRRWIECLLDANEWAGYNPDEARQILARDTGLPEDFLSEAFSPRVLTQLDVSLDPRWVDQLRAKHDALLSNGFLAAPVDFAHFIDPAPLRHALARYQSRKSAPPP